MLTGPPGLLAGTGSMGWGNTLESVHTTGLWQKLWGMSPFRFQIKQGALTLVRTTAWIWKDPQHASLSTLLPDFCPALRPTTWIPQWPIIPSTHGNTT